MQKTILVVEDDFMIAMDLQATLERRGWRVIGPVATVQDALSLLKHEVPAVALLDVHLGNEPVAHSLKENGVPFAVANAYNRPEQFGGPVLSGAPNVRKPTSEARLLAALPLLTNLR